jgi:uncharacterized membrane protein
MKVTYIMEPQETSQQYLQERLRAAIPKSLLLSGGELENQATLLKQIEAAHREQRNVIITGLPIPNQEMNQFLNTLFKVVPQVKVQKEEDTRKHETEIKIEPKQDNEKLRISQSQRRILFKTILYRLIAFALTFIVSYWATRNVKKSLRIGISVEIIQAIIYYIYEQVWNRMNWDMGIDIKEQPGSN